MRYIVDQHTIRQHGRRSRRVLSIDHHEKASKQLYKQILEMPQMQSAKKIAVYIATAEEISLQQIIKWCFGQDKEVFIPVIVDSAKSEMKFVQLFSNTQLFPSSFDILEPLPPYNFVDHTEFDVVLTPLVAFDSKCHRVGMGSGYYDTAFKKLDVKNRPFFIGCAFDCQKVTDIAPNEWDVPVDAVATEMSVYTRE